MCGFKHSLRINTTRISIDPATHAKKQNADILLPPFDDFWYNPPIIYKGDTASSVSASSVSSVSVCLCACEICHGMCMHAITRQHNSAQDATMQGIHVCALTTVTVCAQVCSGSVHRQPKQTCVTCLAFKRRFPRRKLGQCVPDPEHAAWHHETVC